MEERRGTRGRTWQFTSPGLQARTQDAAGERDIVVVGEPLEDWDWAAARAPRKKRTEVVAFIVAAVCLLDFGCSVERTIRG